MPKKALINLTEPMFYVFMAFRNGPLCGTDIASNVNELTSGRVNIGPATLYTLLAKFQEAGYIYEVDKNVAGRKRTYVLSKDGLKAYSDEIKRLQRCLIDAQTIEKMKQEIIEENNENTTKEKTFKYDPEKYRNPGQGR